MATNEPSNSDRIEKQIVLKAPIARVFRALTDLDEFGEWFGVRFEPGLVLEPGAQLRGKVAHPGYEHVTWTAVVDKVEAPRYLSFRWHPYAIEAGVDYSHEPTTLVSFELSEVPEGTHLRITEAGFDAIPIKRRAEAFRKNAEGWSIQCGNLEKHVAKAR